MPSNATVETPADLTPSAKYVLYVLRDVDEDDLRMTDIADHTALQLATINVAVNELREHDLVEKRPDPRDARAVLISLA